MTGFSMFSSRLSAACDSPMKRRTRAISGPPPSPALAPVSAVSAVKSMPAENTWPSP
jgi:hypothetical protein